jgi:hypothetical protein
MDRFLSTCKHSTSPSTIRHVTIHYMIRHYHVFVSSMLQNFCSIEKCRINNLEWFSLNKIIMLPCIMLFKKECCHEITLVLSHCILKFLFKKFSQHRAAYHLVVYTMFLTKRILKTFKIIKLILLLNGKF